MADLSATTPQRAARRPSPTFVALVVAFALAGWACWTGWGSPGVAVFLFVVAGWLVSLCLHEFAHAVVAYRSGDRSVAARGYLRLDPLKYSDPLLSFGLPLLFVLLGGIGLPGGAVWVGAIPGRIRHTLVSAAGPLVNVAWAVLLMAAVASAGPSPEREAFWAGVAYLAFLQVTAALLNLLPVPGLDGFGILEPWLPRSWLRVLTPARAYGYLLLFALLWVPEVNRWFFGTVLGTLLAGGVPVHLIAAGDDLFRFWS